MLSQFAETQSAQVVLRREEMKQRAEELQVLERERKRRDSMTATSSLNAHRRQLKSFDTMKDLVQITSGSTQPPAAGSASTQQKFSLKVQHQRHAAYALAIHRTMDEAGCSDSSVMRAVLEKAPAHMKDLVEMHLRTAILNHHEADGHSVRYPWLAQAEQLANQIVELEELQAD
jgi:hypothetical protein